MFKAKKMHFHQGNAAFWKDYHWVPCPSRWYCICLKDALYAAMTHQIFACIFWNEYIYMLFCSSNSASTISLFQVESQHIKHHSLHNKLISTVLTLNWDCNKFGVGFSAENHRCYLSYIISGGVTYQNNFSEIIVNSMRKPYTSGINQTMQK